MTKRRLELLDLYAGAGMASDGYVAAGFTVTGVDVAPQPCYPYRFEQTDALDYLQRLVDSGDIDRFAAIHASPPCQLHTRAKHLREAQGSTSKVLIDLLGPTIDFLKTSVSESLVWVVENVPGAPGMEGAVVECGSAYGLEVQRHRLFLSNIPLVGSGCNHKAFPLDPISGKPRPWGVFHVPGDNIPKGGRTARDAAHGQQVMGVDRNIPWNSLKEGFPPAYTFHVGTQIRDFLLSSSRSSSSASA